MNLYERLMLSCLVELKEQFGATAVKAEFETEGTRIDELLRLKEVATRAGLGLTLKIGGCESLRDIIESKLIGVKSLVAPMIESPFALRKYVQAVNKVFAKDEIYDLDVLINLETKTAMTRLDQIMDVPEMDKIKSIVFERVDLCFSYGLSPDDVNSEFICEKLAAGIEKLKTKNLSVTIGGGVSADSFPFFESLPKDSINFIETRKITFNYSAMRTSNPEKAILAALAFELFYLKNKLANEQRRIKTDVQRLDVIEQRYWHQINKFFPFTAK